MTMLLDMSLKTIQKVQRDCYGGCIEVEIFQAATLSKNTAVKLVSVTFCLYTLTSQILKQPDFVKRTVSIADLKKIMAEKRQKMQNDVAIQLAACETEDFEPGRPADGPAAKKARTA
jgi:hypothetical protein